MWRIANWLEHFENNRTREVKVLAWVPIPTKMDGDGFTELMDHPNGAAHYGAWITCVHVAAKSHPRGTLKRSSGDSHDLTSLARITRVSKEVLSEAVSRLVSIGWLEVIESQDATDNGVAMYSEVPAVKLRQDCGLPASTTQPCSVVSSCIKVGDSKGKERTKRRRVIVYTPDFESLWKVVSPHKQRDKEESFRRYAEVVAALSERSGIDAVAWLLERATAYYASPLGKTPYCSGPAPWLHRGGYDDNPAAWQRSENNGHPLIHDDDGLVDLTDRSKTGPRP